MTGVEGLPSEQRKIKLSMDQNTKMKIVDG